MAQSKNDESPKGLGLPVSYVPGSQPLRNRVYERYCRARAQALPQALAYREAQRQAFKFGTRMVSKEHAGQITSRIENRPEIQQRIQYLSGDAVSIIAEKRKRLEERLWSIHEADIGQLVETVTIDGKTTERFKRLSDIDPEQRRNIESVTLSASGRFIPRLMSPLEANKELRKMLEIGRDASAGSVARLSDAELVAQLSEQANALGVKVNLNYTFLGDQAPADGVDQDRPLTKPLTSDE